jgi:hypothetical protein
MVQNIKQTGYDLRELAELYGLRGCCKKGTCIHKKAKTALERIDELEECLRLVHDVTELSKSVAVQVKEVLEKGF